MTCTASSRSSQKPAFSFCRASVSFKRIICFFCRISFFSDIFIPISIPERSDGANRNRECDFYSAIRAICDAPAQSKASASSSRLSRLSTWLYREAVFTFSRFASSPHGKIIQPLFLDQRCRLLHNTLLSLFYHTDLLFSAVFHRRCAKFFFKELREMLALPITGQIHDLIHLQICLFQKLRRFLHSDICNVVGKVDIRFLFKDL